MVVHYSYVKRINKCRIKPYWSWRFRQHTNLHTSVSLHLPSCSILPTCLPAARHPSLRSLATDLTQHRRSISPIRVDSIRVWLLTADASICEVKAVFSHRLHTRRLWKVTEETGGAVAPHPPPRLSSATPNCTATQRGGYIYQDWGWVYGYACSGKPHGTISDPPTLDSLTNVTPDYVSPSAWENSHRLHLVLSTGDRCTQPAWVQTWCGSSKAFS